MCLVLLDLLRQLNFWNKNWYFLRLDLAKVGMDSRLLDASQTGSIEELMELLRCDPIIVRRVGLADGDSPLHLSCTDGHFNFVKELLKLRKELAGEINQNGFSCLHIAAANGDLQIVKEILKVDIGLCLVKGRERRIPLNYAVVKGRVDVVKELLSACVESVEVVTSRGETALHLAVKNRQFEVLIQHIKIFNKMEVFNKRDELGNSVLHLAAARKQHKVVPRRKLKNGWLVNFLKYDMDRDSIESVRGGLVVIMLLIAMLTFQAALNPPGNLQQQQPNISDTDDHIVDHLIHYSSHIFLFFNSLAIFISLHVFHITTRAFPLRLELLFSVFAIGITCISCLMTKLPTYFCYIFVWAYHSLLVFALNISRSVVYLYPPKITSANPSLVNQV